MKLLNCRCCDNKTIKEYNNYQICPICFWEDDGTTDENIYSGVNHLFLKDAKLNFITIGVCSEDYLKHVKKL